MTAEKRLKELIEAGCRLFYTSVRSEEAIQDLVSAAGHESVVRSSTYDDVETVLCGLSPASKKVVILSGFADCLDNLAPERVISRFRDSLQAEDCPILLIAGSHELHPGLSGLAVRLDLAEPAPLFARNLEKTNPELAAALRAERLRDFGVITRAVPDQNRFVGMSRLKGLIINHPGLRGVAIVGWPGSGKTAAAGLTAAILKLPLLEIRLGDMKSSRLGESEKKLKAAIASLRTFGRHVLLLDEWDKQTSTVLASSTDGNTSANMLTEVLQYLESPDRDSIVVLTLNRLTAPIESLRAGRTNTVLFSGPLPEAEVRRLAEMTAGDKGSHIPAMPASFYRRYAKDFTAGEVIAATKLACQGQSAVSLEQLQAAYTEFPAVAKLLPKDQLAELNRLSLILPTV